MLMRWDIINHLIKKVDGKRYLEIGCYKGWSFESVQCLSKMAVDPNPSRTPDQEELPERGAISDGNHTIYKMTSDEFFLRLEADTLEFQWDVIFIDGLHEAEQVKRDIENSIKHLAPGGYIVLHDMNPPLEEHTKGGIDGCWTGDCYKALLSFGTMKPFLYHTVDTDWGVGIIHRPEIIFGAFGEADVTVGGGPEYPADTKKALEDWNYFDQNRKELMNIISVEEFLKKY